MTVRAALTPGTTIEENKRTRVIPAAEDDSNKPWRNMTPFEYIGGLSAAEWKDHIVYLYRYDDKGNTWAVGKFTNAIDEFKVQEQFGGGFFNMKVKKGPQLILNEDFRIEGQQKTPVVNSNGNGAPGNSPNESALLMSINALIEELRASRGGTVAQDAIKQAVGISGDVFRSSVEAVKATLGAPAAGAPAVADPMREMQTEFMRAMIAKMLNPTDPIEAFKKMADAVSTLGYGRGGEGKTSMALELARQVPTIASTVVQGLQAWSVGEQARTRQAEIMRGGPPINLPPQPRHSNVLPMPPAPPPAAAPLPPEPPQPQTQVPIEQIPGGAAPPLQIETLEQMIVDIVADEQTPVPQAANEACALIERNMPGQTDKMAAMGEEFMLGFFSTRPVLAQVANHPRLPEFVREFIRVVKSAPTIQEPNPNAPVA